MTSRMAILDGNEAPASVAYRLTEIIAIYPITPASPMGELADEWSQQKKKNIWGTVPALWNYKAKREPLALSMERYRLGPWALRSQLHRACC